MQINKKSGISPILALAIVCGVILINRCTFKKPVSPSWDVRFELPLIDSTYTMMELAEDSDNISVDTSRSEVALEINKETKSIAVGEYLTAGVIGDQNQLDFSSHGTIGSQKTINDTLILQDDILVEEAVFDSGSVIVELNNRSNFTLNLYGEIPSLTINNQKLTIYVDNIQTGESRDTLDLNGVRFTPSISGTSNLVPYSGVMTIIGGSAGFSNVVDMRVDLSKIKYKSVTGWLNQTEVTVDDTVETGIKISEEFQGIQIGSATMQMTILNEVQFPATFNIVMTGYNESEQSDSVRIEESVGAASQVTTDPIDVVGIVNLLPKSLRIHGTAYLGDGSTKATIYKEDSVKTKIHIHAPLIFSLPLKTNEGEVDTIEIEEESRERIQKNLLETNLVFEVENGIPLGCGISFCFSKSRSDSSLYEHPDLEKTMILQSALTGDDPTGDWQIVSQAVPSTMSFGLTKSELEIFEEPQVFWGMKLSFTGTSGAMVKIRPEDYIRVRARIEAMVHTDFEDEDDEKGGGL